MRMPAPAVARFAAAWAAFWIQQAAPTMAHAAVDSPEADSLAVAARLRPIPDDEWSRIAGERRAQLYEVAPGDTLSEISRRLFGDARYWPKIWALNNENITNPHLLRPGKQVAFLAGSGSTLPSVAIRDAAEAPSDMPADALAVAVDSAPTDAPVGPERANGPLYAQAGAVPAGRGVSQEWRRLPPQRWESITLPPPPEVDPLGFDRRSKIVRRTANGFELEMIVTSERATAVGEITRARTEAAALLIGDELFVGAPRRELQVGDTYAVIGEEAKLEFGGRAAFAYPVNGRVQIVGVKDGLYLARVTASFSSIRRGDRLIPVPPRVPALRPIAGQTPMQAKLRIDRRFSAYKTSQHKLAFVNRGSEDGIEPGMIFRAYRNDDPYLKARITDSDYLPVADMQVVQVSERVSTVLILRGDEALEDGIELRLLTDISDLNRQRGVRELRTDGSGVDQSELERVEGIDRSGGLGQREEEELRQLEDHGAQSTPNPNAAEIPAPSELSPEPTPTPTPSPTSAPPPAEDALPEIDGPGLDDAALDNEAQISTPPGANIESELENLENPD